MQVIYSGAEFHNKKGMFSSRHPFDYYGVFYFYTPFIYEKRGQLIRGEAGDLLLSQPGNIVYHGPISSEESFVNDWIYISKDLSALLKKYPIPFEENIHIGKNNILNFAIKAIEKEQNLKRAGYEDKIDCILTEMLIDLHRTYINQKNENRESLIESVHKQIMINPERDWTLNKMAELSGYSPSHFSAVYLKQYGISPKQALLSKRLVMAEQMLILGQYSIGEISESCGFRSIYYFSKYFKKHYGVSPTEFAKGRKPEKNNYFIF